MHSMLSKRPRPARRVFGWVLALWAALLALPARPTRADIDAEQVRLAIERGVNYLKRQQRRDGTWPDHAGFQSGVTSLCTLALLNCGVPPGDPQVQAALDYLRRHNPPADQKLTYTTALQTMVLCAAEPKKDLLLIQQNVAWLQALQRRDGNNKGTWPYGKDKGSGDNSNTQFALLALHEAERVGVPVSEQTWRLAQGYWERTQNVDGSWGYLPGIEGTGSMTCAGIGALVITADKLHRGDAEVVDNRIRCCGPQEANPALDRALAWLGRNFSVHTNPGSRGQTWLLYYLYGVERAGRLANQRFLGQHDWYREGADLLVAAQDRDLSGFWIGVGHAESNPHVATSLALLFLAKGRRPVLIAKLQHEPPGDWNHHRTDLSNLTTYVEQEWKRDLTWQVIDAARATSDDLLQAPVIFLSGQTAPVFSDEQVRRLRDYIDRGGFLFAESCCGDRGFDRGFRQLMQRVFPEPDHKLALLDPAHPIWSAEKVVDPKFLRPLWGIDIGCRTSVVYVPEVQGVGSLSCHWELSRPGRDDKLPAAAREQVEASRAIGINVLAYATNRELKEKLTEIPPALAGTDRSDPVERAKIYVAKLEHSGGWNVAPGALGQIMRTVAKEAGLRVSTEQRPVSLADEQIFNYHLVFLHGRHAFQFTAAQRQQLRKYVERGGMLFGDAVCGSEEFARSFRQEMAAIFPEAPLASIPPSHPMFTREYGGFELKKVSRRDPHPRGADGPLGGVVRQVEPELEGVKLGDRYGVIFSRYDISCALERHESLECAGYSREDAARIGLNVVLYSLYE